MLVTWYFFLLLVSCSVGSYYDGERESCVLCPNGTYQDEEGQITCDSCPSSQNPGNQKLAGAHSVSQCGGKAQKQTIQCFCPFFLLLLELSCTVPEKMPHVQCLSDVQGELLVLIYLMQVSKNCRFWKIILKYLDHFHFIPQGDFQFYNMSFQGKWDADGKVVKRSDGIDSQM